MVLDSQCNKVYLSFDISKVAPKTADNLLKVLQKHCVRHSFLKGTKDIWCRDYMPIQIRPGYIQGYHYDPDYLHQSPEDVETITDGNAVARAHGYPCAGMMQNLRIDGGNIVKAGDYVIMTSKVFEENPGIPTRVVCETIECSLRARLIVLPWDTNEPYGHADGICRYLGDGRILLTNYGQIDEEMARRFRRILKCYFRSVKELKYKVKTPCEHNWAYINWLQLDDLLILPKFGVPEDEQALAQISKLMPDYAGRTEMVDATDLVVHGGCLNCCTWTIHEESAIEKCDADREMWMERWEEEDANNDRPD